MKMFFGVLQLMARFPVLQRIRVLFYFFDSIILLFLKKPVRQQGKKKVIVFFTHSLGDCAMFLSATDFIHSLYPEDEYDVTFSCKSWYADLFKNRFSRLLAIDYIKTSVNPFYRIHFLKEMRKEYYDIALDPFGMEECYPSLFAMNAVCAKEKIGVLFQQRKKPQTPGWLRKRIFTRTVFIDKENMHKNALFATVFSELAGKTFVPRVQEIEFGNTLILPENYFVVFPSASIDSKMWNTERFAEIANRIHSAYGLGIVCCGTENDRGRTQEFISLLNKNIPVHNLLGRTSVMQTAEILGRANFVLTNDTGIYHLAIGTGTKVCVVSGGYTYNMFLDYNGYGADVKNRVKICAHNSICMNCNNDCRWRFRKNFPCVEKITVEEVWKACRELLGSVPLEKAKEII